MIITSEPDTDFALKITKDNVTVRNLIVYHPANGMGIYAWKTKNLRIENVQVIAYGNEWGAQPCPTRSPLHGYRCNNIEVDYGENVMIRNVEVEGGSKGISIRWTPGAVLKKVVARNVRGPYPSGQCFTIQYSDDSVVQDFHCLNEDMIAWPEDSISVYRSSGVVLQDGVVNGGSSPTGQCI